MIRWLDSNNSPSNTMSKAAAVEWLREDAKRKLWVAG
jgi:hypothetical protein